jgi:hypothetical protein
MVKKSKKLCTLTNVEKIVGKSKKPKRKKSKKPKRKKSKKPKRKKSKKPKRKKSTKPRRKKYLRKSKFYMKQESIRFRNFIGKNPELTTTWNTLSEATEKFTEKLENLEKEIMKTRQENNTAIQSYKKEIMEMEKAIMEMREVLQKEKTNFDYEKEVNKEIIEKLQRKKEDHIREYEMILKKLCWHKQIFLDTESEKELDFFVYKLIGTEYYKIYNDKNCIIKKD